VATDLTARVAELAASIDRHLAEDGASMVAGGRDGNWAAEIPGLGTQWGVRRVSEPGRYIAGGMRVDIADHMARNDPARALRRVKATRDLVAAILAERHDYVDGDPWFSCSQAVVPGEDGEPGSGCVDDDRSGKPCDCGRDAKVARLLGIIAGEWEGDRHDDTPCA
jgi:hypothetical protein